MRRRSTSRRSTMWGFALRFTIVHVLTYLVFGVMFMLLTDYFGYFESHHLFKDIMRPSDSIIVRLAVVIQFIRGALLALALYSFRDILVRPGGWAKLFFVMWILTYIGAVITGPGSIEGFIYTKFGFGNPLIGVPEVTLQMLIFSYVFYRWEKKFY